MTRDFKGRAHPHPKGKPQRSCIVWLVAGALLGAFVVGLLWLRLDPALWRSGSGLADTGIPRPQVDEIERPPPSDSLEFQFPDLLRDMTVPVPEETPPQQAALPPPSPTEQPRVPDSAPEQPPATPEREAYLLQMGSFRQASDAEKLKARLAFMGVETRVQKVTINNDDTFHRVLSGPYRSNKELDEVRAMLTRNNIKSIVIKWRG